VRFRVLTPGSAAGKSGCETGAAGAISGSAVVKIIEAHKDDEAKQLSSLGAFIKAMKAATYK
jgi:tryptophan synthase alpha chain